MRTRSLGLGNTILQAGDDMYGYYGKYQGIITPNELISLAGITEGTTKNDAYNDPNADITWLKFSHNYKTLFVADRTIRYGMSWNHLDSKGIVFGRVVEIDGQKYLLRLLQGANVNPAVTGGGANSNDEWDSLIVQFTPNTEDSHWSREDPVNPKSFEDATWAYGHCSWVQETISSDITRVVIRVNSTGTDVSGYYTWVSSNNNGRIGYRPVLEVL